MGCTGSKAKAAVPAQAAPESDAAKTLLEAGVAPEEAAKDVNAAQGASDAKVTDTVTDPVTEEKTLAQKLSEVLEDAKEVASGAVDKAKELVTGAGSDAVVATEAPEAKTAEIGEAKAAKAAEDKALGAELDKDSAPITMVCCFSV
mmetsp:Transcript_85586/g.173662  ORF Transcript_85586/g.173662 Transcript_85586/m.173662 type:complete len:146 (+) Transcript_85586:74-511(+)